MSIKQKITTSRYFNKILLAISKGILDRNLKFRDSHLGETCYIFGNGESIKSMDLKNFSDKVSIGCNNLFLHKDFNELDCRYYQIVAPFIFLPYFRYYGKFQRNDINSLYKKRIKTLNNTIFFTSIFNKFSIRSPNIYYEHHFGVSKASLENYELHRTFSFMAGATYAMIGMAMYMGFKKAILVGVDYTFSDSISHHFFEKGRGVGKNTALYNKVFFDQVKDKINLLTMTIEDGKSDTLKHISYSDYTGKDIKYKENTECVDKESLDTLSKLGFYKIY